VSGLDFECLILTQTMSVRFLVLSIRRDSPHPIRPNFAASDSENPKNASRTPKQSNIDAERGGHTFRGQLKE
jgi:hypothetical protein